jgi:hypothetical protein
MAENSDYENEKKDQELQQGFALISYLVLWPLGWFTFPFESVSPWIGALVFLLFPYFVGSQIKRWALRNQVKPQE